MKSNEGGPVQGRNYIYDSHFEDKEVPAGRRMNRDNAERCHLFLTDSAEPQAAWAARRKFLDRYVTIVLAIEESKKQTGSATDRTRTAKKSIAYMRVVRDLEEAVYHETLVGGLRAAAEKKFSGWQTIMANARAGSHI